MGGNEAELRKIIAELRQKINSQTKTIEQLQKQLNQTRGAKNIAKQQFYAPVKKPQPPLDRAASSAAVAHTLSPAVATQQGGVKRQIAEALSSSDSSIDEETIAETRKAVTFKPPPSTVHNVADFKAFSVLVSKNSPTENPTTTKTMANSNVKVSTPMCYKTAA